MNSRIEVLSRQILVSVSTEDAKIDAALYDEMMACEAIRDLAFLHLRPTPVSVFLHASFRACAKSLGADLMIEEEEGFRISGSGKISRPRFEAGSGEYKSLKDRPGYWQRVKRRLRLISDAKEVPPRFSLRPLRPQHFSHDSAADRLQVVVHDQLAYNTH